MGTGKQSDVTEWAVLAGGVKEDLLEEVTFELRPEG